MNQRSLRARPTIYNGIHMRSRLEATFAQGCDRDGLVWRYEPNCFADERGQYLPDFRLGQHPFLYVEVKPNLSEQLIIEVARRMDIIRSSEPDAQLCIWSPNGAVKLHKGDWFFIEDRGEMGVVAVPGYLWEGALVPGETWRSPFEQLLSRTRFEGCHPTPDSDGNYYAADDPRRPF